MAMKTQGGRKSQQERKTEGSILEKYKVFLTAVQTVYDKGGTELPADVKSQYDFAMRDDRDSLMGFLVYPVITLQMESRLTDMTLGAENKFAQMASDWAGVTKATGYVPEAYSRFHGRRSLELLDAKRASSIPKTGGLLAAAAYLETQSGLGNMLRHWTERTGPFAERSHSGREEKKSAVAEAMDEMGAKGNPRADLEAALKTAEARKAKAVEDDNDEELDKARAEIKTLKAEIATLDKKATDPRADLEAALKTAEARKAKAVEDDNDEELDKARAEIKTLKAEIAKATKPAETETSMPGLDEAVAIATGPKAGKGLKLLYGRWDNGTLDDAGFIAGARAMGAIK